MKALLRVNIFFNLQDATKLQFIENLDKPGEFQAQFRVKLISK